MKKTHVFGLIAIGLLLTTSCGSSNKPLHTVQDLDIDQYLGTWYEIQRFPHSFEKDLQCVSATYSMREDGKIKVINRGYTGDKWKDIKGKAWIPNAKNPGELKVEFFWPFAGDYFVIDVDPKKYSLVGTPDRKYLWILARDKTLDAATLTDLRNKAADLGFDISQLNKISHDCKE